MGSSCLTTASSWISVILFLVALQADTGLSDDGGALGRQKRQAFGSAPWTSDPYYNSFYQRAPSSPYYGTQWGDSGGGRVSRGGGGGSSGWGWPSGYQPSGRHGRTTEDEEQIQGEAVESGRLLSPDSIATISETLGAINTVGRYLVNMTRNGEGGGIGPSLPPTRTEDLPAAIYTISKNVLGRNVTDTIAPYVRGAIPSLGKVVVPPSTSSPYQQYQSASSNLPRPCKTPDGRTGNCDDLSDCPQLLLDFAGLRESICFKSLFSPGVCCPRPDSERPFVTTTTTTRRPVIVTTPTTTTRRPPIPSPPPPTSASQTFGLEDVTGLEDCGMTYGMSSFRIVGGSEALPGRWPWMAAIFLHGPRRTEFWCGGTLVGRRHILTAAHCTRDSRQRPFSARQFTVRLGDLDLKRDDELAAPETFGVIEVRTHPRFSRVGFYNDIAVLVLDRVVGGGLRRKDEPEGELNDVPEGREKDISNQDEEQIVVLDDSGEEEKVVLDTSTSSASSSGIIKFEDSKAIPLRFEDIEKEQDLGGERERLRRYEASAAAFEEGEWRPMESFRRARNLWTGEAEEDKPITFVKFKRHAQKDEDSSSSSTSTTTTTNRPPSSRLQVLSDAPATPDVTNRQGRAETGNSNQTRSNTTRTGGRAYGEIAFELSVGTGSGTVVYSPALKILPKTSSGSISRGRSLTSSNDTSTARTKRESADQVEEEEEPDTLGGPYNRFLTLRPGKELFGKTDPYLRKSKELKEKNVDVKQSSDEITSVSEISPNPEIELFSEEGRVFEEEKKDVSTAVVASEKSEKSVVENDKTTRERRMFTEGDMNRNRRRAGFRGEGRGVSSRRWSRYIAPICLPSGKNREDHFVGERPTVVGWGTTYYGGKESTVQRQVELPVWRNEDCNRSYFQPITSAFICAGLSEGGKDACQGDSGGPLMLKRGGRWMQIGVVSFGNKCGEAGYPGVYTRVTHYLDWIAQNTAD